MDLETENGFGTMPRTPMQPTCPETRLEPTYTRLTLIFGGINMASHTPLESILRLVLCRIACVTEIQIVMKPSWARYPVCSLPPQRGIPALTRHSPVSAVARFLTS